MISKLTTQSSAFTALAPIMNAHYEMLLEGLEAQGFSKFGSLDRGSYSNVVFALSPAGERVALKLFTGDAWKSGISDHFIRELRCMTALQHPNIVPLRSAFALGPAVALCTPLYTTSLFRYINTMAMARKQIPAAVVKHVMRSVVHGVKFAHDNGFAHRDLKPANIFINSNSATMNVAVGDWGLARKLSDVTPSELSPDVISTWYAPPEVLCKSKRYGVSADVWSLGIILLDLVNGQHVFNGDKRSGFVDKIIALLGTSSFSTDDCVFLTRISHKNVCLMPKRPGQLSGVVDKWSASASDIANATNLLSGMLAILPCKRLSCDEILAHPFFGSPDAVDLEAGSPEMDTFRFDARVMRRTVLPPPVPVSLTCHETLSAPYELDPGATESSQTTVLPRVVTILPSPKPHSCPSALKRGRSAISLAECSWSSMCSYSDRMKLLAFLSRLNCFSPKAYASAMKMSHCLPGDRCDLKHMFACYTLSHVAVRPVYELVHLREDTNAFRPMSGLCGSGLTTIAELNKCEVNVLVAAGGNIPLVPHWFDNFSVLKEDEMFLACALVSLPELASQTCFVADFDELETFVSVTCKSSSSSETRLLYDLLGSHDVSCSRLPNRLLF